MVREKTCAGVNGFRVFHAMRREPLGALAALRNLRYTPSLPFPFLQHPTTSERIKRFCCDCCASYGFDEQEMPPLSLLPPWIRLEDAFKTRNIAWLTSCITSQLILISRVPEIQTSTRLLFQDDDRQEAVRLCLTSLMAAQFNCAWRLRIPHL
jgi:hypothetical protein